MTTRPKTIAIEADAPIGRYELRRSRRRTLGITILPGGAMQVAAPLGAPQVWIDQALARKSAWIIAKRRAMANRPPLQPLGFHEGASHLYLGAPLTLRIRQGARARVLKDGHDLCITSPDTAPASIAAALDRWYARQAKRVLQDRFDALLEIADALNRPRPHLALRKMSRIWGNCRPLTGRITLNRDLIRAPEHCIDYVIAHEMCHLVHADHSPAYYALLDRIRPDWRDDKTRLERVMAVG